MKPERLIHKTTQATVDISVRASYYHREAGEAVALRFIDSAERAFNQLLAMPTIGASLGLDELPYEDIRCWHIDGFERLVILYREAADGVEVVRLLHSSRDIPAILRDNPI